MIKKKFLFISNIGKQRINNFYFSSIEAAQQNNFEFHLAANFDASSLENRKKDEEEYNIKIHHIDFKRNPLHPQNIKAYKQLVKLIKKEKIDIVHCNTPVGGVYGRLAAKKCKIDKVIYMAHGFHFFKGAPILNWLMYYPVEKFLSYYADILITINHEDYNRARNKFHTKIIEYVPGVGIDVKKIRNIQLDRDKKREELGIKKKDIVLLSVGELNQNKNHRVVIEALGKLQNKNIKYLIAGVGDQKENLEELAKSYGLEKNVKLLGYRTDVYELCKMSDIFVFPSLREGLSVALMEAIVCNLPVVCTDIRGNNDLIKNGKNGFLVKNNSNEYAERINFIINNQKFRDEIIKNNEKLVNEIDIKNVEKEMVRIYKKIDEEGKK